MWKKIAKEYLTFTKKERRAILVLLIVFGIILVNPYLFSDTSEVSLSDNRELVDQLKQLIPDSQEPARRPGTNRRNIYFAEEVVPGSEFFYFDPNTISEDQWMRLGVNARAAATIRKYISRGGRFRKPEDLKKIYTLNTGVAEKLIPWIVITNPEGRKDSEIVYSSTQNFFSGAEDSEQPANRRQPKNYFEIEINAVDTATLKRLPGIGSARARAMVRYRTSLGGFISIDQVSEVYNLPDSLFGKLRPYLKLDTGTVRKINLNTAKYAELAAHPYIKRAAAEAILAYRKSHGLFTAVADLKQLHYFDDALLQKLIPYFTTDRE